MSDDSRLLKRRGKGGINKKRRAIVLFAFYEVPSRIELLYTVLQTVT